MQELYKLGPQSGAALQIYCEEMLNLHRGQGMDLYWRDTLTLPTEEAYMKMSANKTGGLFRLAVRLMGAVSACDFDFMPLVEKIGLIFQIRDDYKNLVSDEVSLNSNLHSRKIMLTGKFIV
jgi:geranylgeranyl diphosphate synthase type 3